MSGLFSKPKSVKAPAVLAPPVIPSPDTAGGASDMAIKQATQRSGLQKTMLTGDLTPAETGKKKLLGS